MPLDVTTGPIHLTGSQTLAEKLKRLEELEKRGRLAEAWQRMVEFVGEAARDLAPSWHGDLKGSIEEEIGYDDSVIYGLVYTDSKYGPAQERGTDPYRPNIDNLEAWANDHGVPAYKLFELIAARGLKPTKYFERALLQEEEQIVDLVGEVVAEILEA